MKGKAQEPSSERTGCRDSGVRTNLSGLYCKDVSLGPRRRGKLAMVFNISCLLASQKARHQCCCSPCGHTQGGDVPPGGIVQTRGKDGNGPQAVTVLSSDSSGSHAGISKRQFPHGGATPATAEITGNQVGGPGVSVELLCSQALSGLQTRQHHSHPVLGPAASHSQGSTQAPAAP